MVGVASRSLLLVGVAVVAVVLLLTLQPLFVTAMAAAVIAPPRQAPPLDPTPRLPIQSPGLGSAVRNSIEETPHRHHRRHRHPGSCHLVWHPTIIMAGALVRRAHAGLDDPHQHGAQLCLAHPAASLPRPLHRLLHSRRSQEGHPPRACARVLASTDAPLHFRGRLASLPVHHGRLRLAASPRVTATPPNPCTLLLHLQARTWPTRTGPGPARRPRAPPPRCSAAAAPSPTPASAHCSPPL